MSLITGAKLCLHLILKDIFWLCSTNQPILFLDGCLFPVYLGITLSVDNIIRLILLADKSSAIFAK